MHTVLASDGGVFSKQPMSIVALQFTRPELSPLLRQPVKTTVILRLLHVHFRRVRGGGERAPNLIH